MKKNTKKIISKIREKRRKAGKKLMALLVIAGAVILTVGCSGKDQASDSPEEVSPIYWTECGYQIGDHGCDMSLSDQNGEAWDLYSNFGSIVVLDFSTTWCGYCQVAAQTVQSIQDKYEADGVIYATVLVEDHERLPPSQDILTQWSDVFEISAPVLSGNRQMIDSAGESGWYVTGWPTFFILDRDLVIRHIQRGYSDENLVRSIEQVIDL